MRWTALMLVTAALLQGQSASADAPRQGVEAKIVALENQWVQDEIKSDGDAAATLMSEDYIVTWYDGSLQNKSDAVADIKLRKYVEIKTDQVKVNVHGSTAVATGVYKGHGTDAGKPFDETLRWTDTWVRQSGGRWVCVASQYTMVPVH
jgi:ketosteroid isomerase-like protein